MGFLKSLVKKGIGLAGKHLMNTANNMTGGLAGKILDKGVSIANKHSGLIGKTLNTIGKNIFSDETRNKMSNLADKALKYIPSGKIKDTLTKTRHFNITCIIAIQTIRFVHLNVKRLATDIVVYSGFSKEDFEAILNQTNNNVDKKKTVDEYLNLQNKHDKFIMNLSAGKYYFESSV